MANPLTEQLVTIFCTTCKEPFEIEESKVRYAHLKKGAPVTANRCPGCERARLNAKRDSRREMNQQLRLLRQSQSSAEGRLERSGAFTKFLRTSFYFDHNEKVFDRLFEKIEEDVRGTRKFELLDHALGQRVIEELLVVAPETDNVDWSYRRECGRQRREMVEMRRRGEIPMASMFPAINVYHKPEEHIRLGLDVDQNCDECCSVPGWLGTTRTSRRRAAARI
jgi:hypothetical protein